MYTLSFELIIVECQLGERSIIVSRQEELYTSYYEIQRRFEASQPWRLAKEEAKHYTKVAPSFTSLIRSKVHKIYNWGHDYVMNVFLRRQKPSPYRKGRLAQQLDKANINYKARQNYAPWLNVPLWQQYAPWLSIPLWEQSALMEKLARLPETPSCQDDLINTITAFYDGSFYDGLNDPKAKIQAAQYFGSIVNDIRTAPQFNADYASMLEGIAETDVSDWRKEFASAIVHRANNLKQLSWDFYILSEYLPCLPYLTENDKSPILEFLLERANVLQVDYTLYLSRVANETIEGLPHCTNLIENPWRFQNIETQFPIADDCHLHSLAASKYGNILVAEPLPEGVKRVVMNITMNNITLPCAFDVPTSLSDSEISAYITRDGGPFLPADFIEQFNLPKPVESITPAEVIQNAAQLIKNPDRLQNITEEVQQLRKVVVDITINDITLPCAFDVPISLPDSEVSAYIARDGGPHLSAEVLEKFNHLKNILDGAHQLTTVVVNLIIDGITVPYPFDVPTSLPESEIFAYITRDGGSHLPAELLEKFNLPKPVESQNTAERLQNISPLIQNADHLQNIADGAQELKTVAIDVTIDGITVPYYFDIPISIPDSEGFAYLTRDGGSHLPAELLETFKHLQNFAGEVQQWRTVMVDVNIDGITVPYPFDVPLSLSDSEAFAYITRDGGSHLPAELLGKFTTPNPFEPITTAERLQNTLELIQNADHLQNSADGAQQLRTVMVDITVNDITVPCAFDVPTSLPDSEVSAYITRDGGPHLPAELLEKFNIPKPLESQNTAEVLQNTLQLIKNTDHLKNITEVDQDYELLQKLETQFAQQYEQYQNNVQLTKNTDHLQNSVEGAQQLRTVVVDITMNDITLPCAFDVPISIPDSELSAYITNDGYLPAEFIEQFNLPKPVESQNSDEFKHNFAYLENPEHLEYQNIADVDQSYDDFFQSRQTLYQKYDDDFQPSDGFDQLMNTLYANSQHFEPNDENHV